MIIGFNPKNGSPRGGKTIIINGTNLGKHHSDIETVMIGDRNCNINEHQPGVTITCTIVPDTNDNTVKNETITFGSFKLQKMLLAPNFSQFRLQNVLFAPKETSGSFLK